MPAAAKELLKIQMLDLATFAQEIAAGPSPQWRLGRARVTPITALGLLANQQLWPRFYWRSRDHQHELAALGAAAMAHSLEEAQQLLQQLPPALAPLLVGGLAFDEQQPQWRDFPGVRLFVPQLLWQRLGNEWQLLLAIAPGEAGQQQAEQLLAQFKADDRLPQWQHQGDHQSLTPDRQQWQQWVKNSLGNAQLAKVVLARHSSVQLQQAANPWVLLSQWQQAEPHSYPFAVAFNDHSSFIGCSPERLFARHQRQLASEALAGTIARAADGSLSSRALTEDDKIQLENQLVAQDIISRLAPLAEQWQLGANEVSQQAALAHLRRPIQAQLQAGVSDFALLRALHPTPAVGGLPRAAALAHIRATESYPRGWYAGAVGYLGHEQSELTVAIRSALIEGQQLHLFAGAGLVKGSDAASEWQELNHKLSTQLQILGLSR